MLEARRVKSANIRLQPLVQAASGFWGETEYELREGEGVYYDSKKDHFAPLVIAASVEKGALNDPRVQVDSARMVVTGNSEFILTNSVSQANLDFVMGSLNWLLDREELIGVTPKIPNAFTLNLSQEQITNIAMFTIIIIPAMVALLGFSVCWARRF